MFHKMVSVQLKIKRDYLTALYRKQNPRIDKDLAGIAADIALDDVPAQEIRSDSGSNVFTPLSLERLPFARAGSRKPTNYDTFMLGYTPAESVKNLVKSLIRQHRYSECQVPFSVLWHNLKSEMTKNSLSVNLKEFNYEGVKYKFWDFVDEYVKIMDQMAEENDPVLSQGTTLTDRRHNSNDVIDGIFEAVAKKMIVKLSDQESTELQSADAEQKAAGSMREKVVIRRGKVLQDDELMLSIKDFARQVLHAENTGIDREKAGFFTQYDKDNNPHKYNNEPILIAWRVNTDKEGQLIVNSNIGMIQGEQGFEWEPENVVQIAGAMDMFDALNTMFMAKGDQGKHEPTGCGQVYRVTDAQFMKIVRSVMDVQASGSKLKAPSFKQQTLLTSLPAGLVTLGIAATLTQAAIWAGLSVTGAGLGVIPLITFCSAYFGYERLNRAFSTLVQRYQDGDVVWRGAPKWAKHVLSRSGWTDWIVNDVKPLNAERVDVRAEYLAGESAIEDCKMLQAFSMCLELAVQVKTEMFDVAAEGDLLVSIGQYMRWNSAKLELVEDMWTHAKMFVEMAERNELSSDIVDNYVDSLRQEGKNFYYPRSPMYMMNYARNMLYFGLLGVSAFNLFTGPLVTLLGGPLGILAFTAAGLLNYKLGVMRTLERHGKVLGHEPDLRDQAVTRFLNICTILAPVSEKLKTTLAKMAFNVTEPKEISVFQYFKNVYLNWSEIKDFWNTKKVSRSEALKIKNQSEAEINSLTFDDIIQDLVAEDMKKVRIMDKEEEKEYKKELTRDYEGKVSRALKESGYVKDGLVTAKYEPGTYNLIKKEFVKEFDVDFGFIENGKKREETKKSIAAILERKRCLAGTKAISDKEWLERYFTNPKDDELIPKKAGVEVFANARFTKSECGLTAEELKILSSNGYISKDLFSLPGEGYEVQVMTTDERGRRSGKFMSNAGPRMIREFQKAGIPEERARIAFNNLKALSNRNLREWYNKNNKDYENKTTWQRRGERFNLLRMAAFKVLPVPMVTLVASWTIVKGAAFFAHGAMLMGGLQFLLAAGLCYFAYRLFKETFYLPFKQLNKGLIAISNIGETAKGNREILK